MFINNIKFWECFSFKYNVWVIFRGEGKREKGRIRGRRRKKRGGGGEGERKGVVGGEEDDRGTWKMREDAHWGFV